MASNSFPPPSLTITELQARQFLLAHQRLLPPRALKDKEGTLHFLRHIGCIQYDPVNVISRNPDLVLQARVADYRLSILDELLYQDRLLKDGWDKQAAIFPVEDWPVFQRRRMRIQQYYHDENHPALKVAPEIMELIRQEGPKSSLDLSHNTRIMGPWGVETKIGRTALEILDGIGEAGIHHRVNSRRIFDLNERLLPPAVFSAPDPNTTLEAYHDWHVLRRVGSLGLANPSNSEYWMGIVGMKSQARQNAIRRLIETGELISVAVEELPGRNFFMRSADLGTFQSLQSLSLQDKHAVFLPPLDNLLWDRELLRMIFHFDYVWEVYKKPHQRKYGYYTLPVLYGDRFIARFESTLDRKKRSLILKNWWWEEGFHPDMSAARALNICMREFRLFLGAETLEPAPDFVAASAIEYLWNS